MLRVAVTTYIFPAVGHRVGGAGVTSQLISAVLRTVFYQIKANDTHSPTHKSENCTWLHLFIVYSLLSGVPEDPSINNFIVQHILRSGATLENILIILTE